MKLSIIIANHNYRNFVGAAITSAMAVDWSNKEVIVVDDASTDDSKTVIDGFGSSVTAYFRPKSNQLGAHIFGIGQSTGEVIIFLDADDLLEPEVMREVARIWRPGVSKVQYRMNLIDTDGAQLGTAFPQFPQNDDPERLRRSFLNTLTYAHSPGTGNAYSRDFVQRAFSMAPSTMPASDTVLYTLAPVFGDVLTIRKPLARYRIHDANYAALETLDAAKFRRRLHEDVEILRLLSTASQPLHLSVRPDALNRSWSHLQYRLASYLVEPEAHPFPQDTAPNLLYRLVSSGVTCSQMRLRARAILLAWVIACGLMPRVYQKNLILWRFAPTARPAVLKTLLSALSSLRSSRLPNRA